MATAFNPPSGENALAALRAVLRGQYAVEKEIGRGGMGIVFLARDERLDRAVALKILPPHLAEQQETRERFLREARMAAQLSHPHIVPVYRADEIDGYAFFAMGFVEGETLADRIRDRGTLPPRDVVRLLREVAWALAYAHARGIVHRDIKPENILVERGSGRAIVTDFGIARAETNPSLTADGHVLGTVHYMSPEQVAGETIDGRSDLYALGCVGYLALSGRLPLDAPSPQAVLLAHATRPAPPLRSVAPAIPAALADIIDRCLAKSPADRWADGEQLAEQLGKALDEVDDRNSAAASPTAVISNEQAMAVWRRAAELQAEAATRLEMRLRLSERRPAADDRAVDAGDASNEPGAIGAYRDVASDAYRLRDVEAAAREVGISEQYVALALAELRESPERAAKLAHPVAEWKQRLATRLFGTTRSSVSVSRIFRHSPRDVLQAIGRALQHDPYRLKLRDTLGGHPLDGGVLLFQIPDMTGVGEYPMTWTRYGVFAKEVRLAIAAVPGDPRACEVTAWIDLREGLNANLAGYGGGGAAIATGGGVVGGVIAAKAFAIAGALALLPAVGVAAVLGVSVLAVSGPIYRWEMRKASTELDAMLASIDAGIRALDIFGEERLKMFGRSDARP